MTYFVKSILLVLAIASFESRSATSELTSKVDLAFTGCEKLRSQKFVYDKECVEKFYNNHPMTRTSLSEWQAVIKKPVHERLVEATEEMVQYMILDNLLWGFPYENIQPVSDPQLLRAAQEALDELPQPLMKYIDEHFYGFMLVSGVGWTGFASSILETPGVSLKPGAVIIINADNVQNRNLNEWLVFRETTTFSAKNNNKVSITYDRVGRVSTLKDNLRHFLIHETAHLIVNADPSIHPAFKFRNKPVPFTEFEKWTSPGQSLQNAFPFLNFSWNLSESVASPKDSSYLLTRKVPSVLGLVLKDKPIKFYGSDESAKFTDSEATLIYKHLNNTCFPSLYAMVDYSEDFAETVTHYFMSYKEGHEYSVHLKKSNAKGEKTVAKFVDDLWSDPKCADKVQFMKDLFEN